LTFFFDGFQESKEEKDHGDNYGAFLFLVDGEENETNEDTEIVEMEDDDENSSSNYELLDTVNKFLHERKKGRKTPYLDDESRRKGMENIIAEERSRIEKNEKKKLKSIEEMKREKLNNNIEDRIYHIRSDEDRKKESEENVEKFKKFIKDDFNDTRARYVNRSHTHTHCLFIIKCNHICYNFCLSMLIK
jgi:hypothetical protein